MESILSSSNRVLVLAPHTDDGELGCGATLSKFHRQGFELHYVAFCSCDESLPDGFPNGTLARELKAAADKLSIKRENVYIKDFEVRRLNYYRQEVLDTLVQLNRSLQPDIVFCPTLNDLHQDHLTVAQEAARAFKTRTILCYEVPWNNIDFRSNFLVEVDEEDIQHKVDALSCYTSQKHRPYMNDEFIRSLARARGVTIGTRYAEAFTLLRGVYR